MIEKESKKGFYLQAAALLGSMLLALGFWGIAFPQYLFTEDCVKIVDEDGRDVTGEVRAKENLFCKIGSATQEQIEVRIGILDWAKEKALRWSAEKPDG